MRSAAQRVTSKLAVVAAAAALLLAACSTAPAPPSNVQVGPAEVDKAMTTPTTVTFWSWIDNAQQSADLFTKKYPAITVKVVDVGSGSDFYTKLRSSIESGQGAPDVAQVEFHHIPSFVLGKHLLDLAPYGVGQSASRFEDFAWKQVAIERGVYGVPEDTGPLGLAYRNDILAANGIAPPATWDEFATAARALHAKNPSTYLANVSPNNASAMIGLFWQAGAKPFAYDGAQTVSINLASDAMKRVAAYWDGLIDAGAVSVDPDFTDSWYQGLAKGKYASWVAAAWGPMFLQGTAKGTSGLWRAAPLPQWKAGEKRSGNVGGSASVVLAKSPNPIPAAKFAEFLTGDPEPSLKLATEQFLFPTAKETLAKPEFLNKPVEFFGNQEINKLYADISGTVDPDFQWLPFMDTVYESFNETVGAAMTGNGSMVDALAAWQDKVVAFAKSQGFTVRP